MTSPGSDDAADSVFSWDGGVNSWSDAELDICDWIKDERLQNGDGDGLLEKNEGEPDVEELEGAELEVSLEESENLKQTLSGHKLGSIPVTRSAQSATISNRPARKKQKIHVQGRARAFRSFFTQTAVKSDPVPSLFETEELNVLAQNHPPFQGHLPVEVNQ
ncbi:hypothetical protein BC835DRAFT_1307316 [Cytidiella melzeri]|nr:hypothetical protein BC835DRAFT_1307316 [Cytidiella melzeri]